MNTKMKWFAKLALLLVVVAGYNSAVRAAIIAPTAVSASQLNGDYDGGNMIDGSGMTGTFPNTASDTHTNGSGQNTMWLSDQTGIPGQVVQLDLGAVYNLTSLILWNYNQSDNANRGVSSMLVSTGNTALGGPYTSFGTVLPLQADGTGADSPETFGLAVSGVRYVQFSQFASHGGTGNVVGISEVRFEGTLVPEPSSLTMLAFGSVFLWLAKRRRSR
jgi:hypothetical protein